MTWLIKQCMVVYWGYYSINSFTGIYLYIICEIISNQVEAAISSKKTIFIWKHKKLRFIFKKKKHIIYSTLIIWWLSLQINYLR